MTTFQIPESLQINNIRDHKTAEYEQSGRPSKLAKPTQINYRVTGELETKLEVIEAEKTEAGRFILATNIIDKTELTPCGVVPPNENAYSV